MIRPSSRPAAGGELPDDVRRRDDEDDAAVLLGSLSEAPPRFAVAQFRCSAGDGRVPVDATASPTGTADHLNIAAIHCPAARTRRGRGCGAGGALGRCGQAPTRLPGTRERRGVPRPTRGDVVGLAAIKARVDPGNSSRHPQTCPGRRAEERRRRLIDPRRESQAGGGASSPLRFAPRARRHDTTPRSRLRPRSKPSQSNTAPATASRPAGAGRHRP